MTTPRSDHPIYKAHGLGGDQVPNLRLVANEEVPELSASPTFLADATALYREQGRAIAVALRASLPGGTIDALLVELLTAKASVLRVPLGPVRGVTDEDAR